MLWGCAIDVAKCKYFSNYTFLCYLSHLKEPIIHMEFLNAMCHCTRFKNQYLVRRDCCQIYCCSRKMQKRKDRWPTLRSVQFPNE